MILYQQSVENDIVTRNTVEKRGRALMQKVKLPSNVTGQLRETAVPIEKGLISGLYSEL
jgi:hypothetical protein